jgi:hypothetical protein
MTFMAVTSRHGAVAACCAWQVLADHAVAVWILTEQHSERSMRLWCGQRSEDCSCALCWHFVAWVFVKLLNC